MTHFLPELEQDPFDSEEFVERLAWKTANSQTDVTEFDPNLLYEAFDQSIVELKVLYESTQKRCEHIESSCREEEKKYSKITNRLLEQSKASFDTFKQLEERIDYVATKVVHLGDQLDSVNTPRARAVEAQKLMKYFAEFLTPGPLTPDLLLDSTKLNENADIIQKLYIISQELPLGKFDKARQKITLKYDEIEQILIEEFVRAHRADDRKSMKEMALILSHFKGYSECINAFIEQSQMGAFIGTNIFMDILPLCTKSNTIIQEVFSNPEQVMAKFVLNIFHGKLQEHVHTYLVDNMESEKYLRVLYDLYSKTTALCTKLDEFHLGNDSSYLSKLTMNIFGRHLEAYINLETRCLKEKCVLILQQYYDSIGHHKKNVLSGIAYELKRDLQVKLGNVEDYRGETFLSEEVAINILQESKLSFQRCKLLSKSSDLPANAVQLLSILLHYLCIEHIDYALELGLYSIPEPKTQPKIYFFDIIRQCNAIIQLLEKKIADSVNPLVISTSKHGECMQKKRSLMEQMETKIENGLEKSLTYIIGWAKVLLSEQKKTDFKPEAEDASMISTAACNKVVKFMTIYVDKIRECLDGQNVEAVLTELGLKFHRLILDHFQQFQISSFGGMIVICDVNEYRKIISEFKIPFLNVLFDTLHALCNLLIVDPKNLAQICNGDPLDEIDKSVLMSFVQLRADFKTAKLGNILK